MQVLSEFDPDEIARLRAAGEFFWLDLTKPDAAHIERLAELFELHPMAHEDLIHRDQRPKLDDYGDYVVLVFYGARTDAERRPALIEVELVISGSYIISVHDGECAELSELRTYFERRTKGSEQFVVYRVVDALTDTFFPVLSDMDDEIDRLEEDVIERPTDEQLQRLFRLKRDLVVMRKVVTPQRDLFARAGDDIISLPGLAPATRDYFRDVYDHLIRISDLIDSYRDLLSGAMDVYLSVTSNRLNVQMKTLTVIATIFLPLTFITGFFGQNFGWLVGDISSLWTFLVYGIGILLMAAVALVIWFRRRGFT